MRPATLVVTGLSSFVGSHLARWFARSYRVLGTLTRPAAEYDALRDARIRAAEDAGVTTHTLDLLDAVAVRNFIESERPTVWVQHAGWAAEYGSHAYDLERGHAVNVAPLGLLYPLLAKVGCRGMVVTGSSAEYADSEQVCREDDPCWPATPYGLSKLTATLRARQLAHEFGLPTRVARVFLPFGPLDAPQKVLPAAVSALRRGEPIDLSPCAQSRDFLHVEDLARGYAVLVADFSRGQVFDLFNLCGGAAVELRRLLLDVALLLQSDPELLRFGRRTLRPGEAPVSFGSNEKARTLLGWQPRSRAEALRAYLRETEARPAELFSV